MATVTCAVSKGDFPINITWTLNGRPVEEIEGISALRTNKRISQLSVDDVKENHAGIYDCAATNPAGSVSHSANLQVNGIYRITWYLCVLLELLEL